MRSMPVVAFVVALAGAGALAESPAAQDAAQAARLFASSADVQGLIAKAKAERRPDQANFVQPIVRQAPYTMNLEYRVAGLNANASVHEQEAELFVVVEGAGMLVTGGTLREERRTNPANRSGTAIDGGSRQRVAKGDVALVPQGVPHWFTDIDGTLVLMSMHLPVAAPAGRD
jgi:mannose-6-phosphate isomerase-like protein (cupin superfamily)